jgi:hypothetical protein
MPTPFRKIYSTDSLLTRVQDAVAASLDSLLRLPILNSQIVSAQLTTSGVDVSHGLGREIQGWIVVRKSATADVYEVASDNNGKRTLKLASSAPVSVSILFF